MSYEIDRPIELADVASLEIERQIDRALQEHKGKIRMTPNGKCWNCLEVVGVDLYFCDTDCRDDWDYIEKRKR